MPAVAADTGYQPLEKRGAPRLDGSAPAFVALIVVLALVIVICGSGIAYILWENSHKDRRTRIRRYKVPGLDGHGDPSKHKWTARLRNLFYLHSRPHVEPPTPTLEAPEKRTSIHGWLQTVQKEASRDVLATIQEHPESLTVKNDGDAASGKLSEIAQSTLSTVSVLDTLPRLHHPHPHPTPRRSSSLLSDKSQTASFISTLPTHPEISTPKIQPSIPSVIEHLASPSTNTSTQASPSVSPRPVPSRTLSADHTDYIYPNGKGRPFATQSGTSITLDGGTKFMEEL